MQPITWSYENHDVVPWKNNPLNFLELHLKEVWISEVRVIVKLNTCKENVKFREPYFNRYKPEIPNIINSKIIIKNVWKILHNKYYSKCIA